MMSTTQWARRAAVAAAAALSALAGVAVLARPAGAETTGRAAGCVAQVIAVYGPPGPQVASIKQASPAPGQFISSVAHQPVDGCGLGG